METPLAVFFAALFLFASALQVKIILRALAALRSHPDTRLPLNYLLLAIGVLTLAVAAGFALLFGAISLNNLRGADIRSDYALEWPAISSAMDAA